MMVTLEWKFSEKKVVEEYSQGPDVHLLPIGDGFKYFWCHVVLSTTVGVGLDLKEAGKAEVSNFTGECILLCFFYEYILKFEVSMDDLIFMDNFNSSQNLVEDVECFLKGEYFVS